MSRSRVLVLGVCLALLLAAPVVLVTRAPDADRSPSASTYSSHPRGCKALYLLLEELKLPVMRLRNPLARLESHSGTLIIINPRKAGFTRREWDKLKEWVNKGNRLVIFQGADMENEEKKGNTVAADGQSFSFKVRQASNVAAYFGLAIKRISGSSRATLPVFLPGMDEVGSISVSNEARWKEPHNHWTSLAGDKDGAVLLVRDMGNGKIAALCDPSLPSNRFLDREHNLMLVLALLLAEGTPREILFDEYHHGHVLSENLWGYLWSSVGLWALLQALLGTLLFFYSRRARHAGRYRSLELPKGRSSLEYVESMAHVFESYRAASAGLELILRRFLGKLSRRTGARPGRLDDDCIKTLSVILPTQGDDLARLLTECRQAVFLPDDPDKALKLAAQLAAIGARLNLTRPYPKSQGRSYSREAGYEGS